MTRFIKKPVEIVAEQYVEYGRLVKGMCNSQTCFSSGNNAPHVHTIHGSQIVNLEVGDWVVPEPDGIHYYPIKPDILKATYYTEKEYSESHMRAVDVAQLCQPKMVQRKITHGSDEASR